LISSWAELAPPYCPGTLERTSRLHGLTMHTFTQRRPEIASRLLMFEVDQPGPQAWKRQRLIELGFGIPEWLRLVPVDLEAGDAWWQWLGAAGFNAGQPAVVASTGVSPSCAARRRFSPSPRPPLQPPY